MSAVRILKFKSHSEKETEQLGQALAIVLREMFNLAAVNPAPAKQVVHVTIHAAPGVGKSTFMAALAEKMVDGLIEHEDYEQDHEMTKFSGEWQTLAWGHVISHSKKFHHRLCDSMVGGPYQIPGVFKGRKLTHRALPERQYPGIDMIEHPRLVPKELVDCAISLHKARDGSHANRVITVRLPRKILSDEKVKNEFLPEVQEFLI